MGEIPGHYQDRRADFWPSLTFSVGTARIKIRPEHTNHAAVGAPSKQRGQETEPGPSFSKESISRRVLRVSQEVALRRAQGRSREISQIAINAHFRHYRGGSRAQDCGEVRVGHVTDSPPSTTRPRAGQIRGYFGLLGTGPLYAGRPGRTYLLRTRIRHRRPGRSPRWRPSFRGRRISRPKRVSQINLTSCCHV